MSELSGIHAKADDLPDDVSPIFSGPDFGCIHHELREEGLA
jgi:hypothetical protein